MPVNLEKIPPIMLEPPGPRVWRWLLLLGVLLLLGLGLAVWLGRDVSPDQLSKVWVTALGAAFAVWCVLGLMRASLYIGQCVVVDKWNDEREAHLVQTMRRARRSQQVLAVSLHTALRTRGAEGGELQSDALHNGTKVLTVQPDWLASKERIRHSRLSPEQSETPEQLLRRVLQQVLADIAKVLKPLPEDKSLALLLDVNSSIPDKILSELWQEVWSESGIRQTVMRVEGTGLSVVDAWLDARIEDEALLLVVAFQVAPAGAQGTAEAVVGLLFGNRRTQTLLEPMAYLHRPEQEREPTPDSLLYATRQALDWVPVKALSVGHVWVVGADPVRKMAITMAINSAPLLKENKQGLRDLDACLGNPHCAAPWVAIAAAVESIRGEKMAHFIFSGDSTADSRLWCSVVMPPSVS